MKDDPGGTETLESEWNKLEADIRGAFEHNLTKLRKGLFGAAAAAGRPNTSRKKKKPPILHITAIYFDSDIMMPIAIHTHDVLGTHEEIARLLQHRVDDLVGSFAYRKNQQIIFNRLKDEFKIKDRDILDMLIPEADREERDGVYRRLKQGRRRRKAAKRTTKKPLRSLPQPPE